MGAGVLEIDRSVDINARLGVKAFDCQGASSESGLARAASLTLQEVVECVEMKQSKVEGQVVVDDGIQEG